MLQCFDYRDIRLAGVSPPVRKTTVCCALTNVPSNVMGGNYKKNTRLVIITKTLDQMMTAHA
jgi:hypothetical protein